MSKIVLAESSTHRAWHREASSGCVLFVLTQWSCDVVWPLGEGACEDHPKGRIMALWVGAQSGGPAPMGPGVTRRGLE